MQCRGSTCIIDNTPSASGNFLTVILQTEGRPTLKSVSALKAASISLSPKLESGPGSHCVREAIAVTTVREE